MSLPEALRPLMIETGPDALYSVPETARVLGCSTWTVERAMRAGELAYVKAGAARNARVRIRLAEIRAWQARHTIRRTRQDAPGDAPPPTDKP